MKSFFAYLSLFAVVFNANAQQEKPGSSGKEGRGGGGGDRSPIFSAIDLNGDREISPEELANATTALSTLDRNNNGTIERDELTLKRPEGGRNERGMRPQSADGQRPRTPWILVHALEIDVNGDGVVEFEEEMMTQANSVFDAYDKNDDQRITPDESNARGGMPRSPLGGFVREHAAELDRDNDGGISKEELTGQFANFFERADKNGDLKLTKDEYEVEGGANPRFPERARGEKGSKETQQGQVEQ